MSDFRDNLAMQITGDWPVEQEEFHPHDDAPYTEVFIIATPDEVVDSVLAHPDLQAIRRFIREFMPRTEQVVLHRWLAGHGLSFAVAQWVLADD